MEKKKDLYAILTDSLLEATIEYFHPKKKSKKPLGMMVMTLISLSSVSLATAAWFMVSTRNNTLQAVSGDMNINIQKISAYKYVYPYYQNSTELIDYGLDGTEDVGTVKKYVIEDSSMTSASGPNTTAVTFDTPEVSESSFSTTNEGISKDKIYADERTSFRYYLVGDSTFNGYLGKDWCLSSAASFALQSVATDSETGHAILRNVPISLGSNFAFIDYKSKYYYEPNIAANQNFAVNTDGKTITCLASGLYNFDFNGETLNITKQSSSGDMLIGNNIFDPTIVNIEWLAMTEQEKSNYENSVANYMADAIESQNTMIILDVELLLENKNPIEISIDILRDSVSSKSVYSLLDSGSASTSCFDDQSKNTTGYINDTNQNSLRASDFNSYFAIIDDTVYPTYRALWDSLHKNQNSNDVTFTNFNTKGNTYNTSSVMSVTNGIVPALEDETTYHLYIGIDYDDEYAMYFYQGTRLGKHYVLDRDYSFYLKATQKVNS